MYSPSINRKSTRLSHLASLGWILKDDNALNNQLSYTNTPQSTAPPSPSELPARSRALSMQDVEKATSS